MATITTGRPLDDGEPTDGPALEIDPDGPAAELFRASSFPLASSPGARMWSSILRYPEDETRPAMLVWVDPGATPLPEHVHTNGPETFEAVEGTCTIVLDGEPLRLEAGESLTIVPGQEHTFRNDTDEVIAVRATVPWKLTIDTQFTLFGLDHDGAFARGDGYGQPGPLQALVMSEAIRNGTTITAVPMPAQRVLWATVVPVARRLGYTAVDDRYLDPAFWERHVEQPDL